MRFSVSAKPAKRIGFNRWLRQLYLFALMTPACIAVPTVYADTTEAAAERPQLVVVVSVDQWRQSYFQRFAANLANDGVARRTQQQGLWFDNCYHQHAFTFTGPGHSVLLTGAYPSTNGIIANNWYDRQLGKERYCVLDPEAQIIGTTNDEKPVSPRSLLVGTVGDQLKLATGRRSKVFGVAIKDRAAILMAGRMADAAYWMSNDGKWITTNHYRDDLPGYLRQLNEQRAVFQYAGKVWQRSLPADRYLHGEVEDSKHERPVYDISADFPHTLVAADHTNYIKQLACSPFGNEATLQAARMVIEHEQLGQDEHPDLLAINFSSNDYVGHAFGPHSLEVEDMTYRTDRQLGQFMEYLDQQLKGRPWLMLVTADHGVCPIVERVAEWKLRSGRDPLGPVDDNGNFDAMRQQLDGRLRAALRLRTALPLVEAVTKNQVFLNHRHPAVQRDNGRHVASLARDFLIQHPAIAASATRERLLQDCSGDKWMTLLQRSFHPQRSGDVLFYYHPYYISGNAGTTHGSPWSYDRHVPLMIVGNKARYTSHALTEQETSPASIAATVCQVLNIELPDGCEAPSLQLSPAPPTP